MITVTIPTYNRIELWQNGYLWRTLEAQPKTDFEVIIVDDGSTDGTSEFLPRLAKRSSFKTRIFRVAPRDRSPFSGSIIPDNVGIKEAHGDVLMHVDDDCFLPSNVLRRIDLSNVKMDRRFYYGEAIFVNRKTLIQNSIDLRSVFLRACERQNFLVPFTQTSVFIEKDSGMCWGAVYVCPTDELRRVGGHDMTRPDARGADARIGERVSLPCYYTANLPYYHLGHKQEIEAEESSSPLLKDILAAKYVPLFKDEGIVNGGEKFWDDMNIDYDLVYEN